MRWVEHETNMREIRTGCRILVAGAEVKRFVEDLDFQNETFCHSVRDSVSK